MVTKVCDETEIHDHYQVDEIFWIRFIASYITNLIRWGDKKYLRPFENIGIQSTVTIVYH